MIGRFFRRRLRRALALTTDRHFPPAPKSPPPPPPRPEQFDRAQRAVDDFASRHQNAVRRQREQMTDRELLEEILDRVDRIAFPHRYWRGGPR